MKRNDWHMKEGDYYISVLGVVRRSDGKFLITQRVMTKEWAPGWWEIPGGAVKAGESSLEAVIREVREETGLDVSGKKGDISSLTIGRTRDRTTLWIYTASTWMQEKRI